MDVENKEAVGGGVSRLIDNIQSVISIGRRKLEHLLAAHIAGGHVLLADSHGVGKTSLAKALAGSILWEGGNHRGRSGDASPQMDDFSRIQCTVDLLPQDILGYNRIYGSSHELVFNKGPLFAHFVLCDEINLLTPKTQGSFFQAMEEQTVTVEGQTFELENPFFIIATMNLKGAHLFPLPAPQLDRFMVQLSMGYPDARHEAGIVQRHGREDAWADFGPVVPYQQLLQWKALVDQVSIHPEVVAYIVSCVRRSREHEDVDVGASPRTGVKLSRMSRALAMIRGQDYVSIDTIKEIIPAAMTHRLVMKNSAQPASTVIEEILDTVPVEVAR
ncbi:MAG: MoxR family ATPase [Spirochaetaceae bacterium]|nr:MAG: MoxR family ATPase [Spirochaetaceae bacterium]